MRPVAYTPALCSGRKCQAHGDDALQEPDAACALLAKYLAAHTGTITPGQIAALPDFVFELALFAGWLPEIPIGSGWITDEELDADHVVLGQEVVHRNFREQFVALIQETLDEVKLYDEEEGTPLLGTKTNRAGRTAFG